MAIVYLYNKSDIKFEGNSFYVKRKYGKFTREPIVIDSNTEEGQAYLKAINGR